MKKDEQIKINNEVILKFSEYCADGNRIGDAIRLNHCRAHVDETKNYYILVSYKSIVAFIDKNTHICYDILRYTYGYTSTSAQHIAKFRNAYGAVGTLTYRPVKEVSHD